LSPVKLTAFLARKSVIRVISRSLFADADPNELQILEKVLKKAGKRASALAEERSESRSR
jgi:hypothetical protein